MVTGLEFIALGQALQQALKTGNVQEQVLRELVKPRITFSQDIRDNPIRKPLDEKLSSKTEDEKTIKTPIINDTEGVEQGIPYIITSKKSATPEINFDVKSISLELNTAPKGTFSKEINRAMDHQLAVDTNLFKLILESNASFLHSGSETLFLGLPLGKGYSLGFRTAENDQGHGFGELSLTYNTDTRFGKLQLFSVANMNQSFGKVSATLDAEHFYVLAGTKFVEGKKPVSGEIIGFRLDKNNGIYLLDGFNGHTGAVADLQIGNVDLTSFYKNKENGTQFGSAIFSIGGEHHGPYGIGAGTARVLAADTVPPFEGNIQPAYFNGGTINGEVSYYGSLEKDVYKLALGAMHQINEKLSLGFQGNIIRLDEKFLEGVKKEDRNLLLRAGLGFKYKLDNGVILQGSISQDDGKPYAMFGLKKQF